MQRSHNALVIYKNLYYNSDETSPEQVHKRVAEAIANNSQEYDQFLYMLDHNIFRPSSPIMMNANKKKNGNLFACFVVNLEDSMENIIELWNTSAKIYSNGAGCGFPLSNLREKGSPIRTGGCASGPLAYAKTIDVNSDTVRSGGKTRRAANLASVKYYHPDIIDIIKCKLPDSGHDFKAINFSILVDDTFMSAVSKKKFDQEVGLISPNESKKVNTITVGEIWKTIIDCAWTVGDPGLLFYNISNQTNSLPSEGEIIAANACSEVPLPVSSCCNLASINLNKVLSLSNKSINVDYDLLKKYTKYTLLFLDNVIDKSLYINYKFREVSLRTRPVGIGLMGFADILYKLKIGYNTEDARLLFENICKTITKTAFEESIELAKEKSPIITKEHTDHTHFKHLLEYYDVDKEYLKLFDEVGIRNSTVTAIAPSGTIALSAECSYAFEPQMALVWQKNLVDDRGLLTFTNEEFMNTIYNHNILKDINQEQLLNDIVKNKGSIQTLSYIDDDIKKVFVVAHDIKWNDKILMQSMGQRYITLGISSTCNLPNYATKEDIENIYISAWYNKLKGITVFRDGCKEQIVKFGSDKYYNKTKEKMKRPIVRQGKTIEIQVPNLGNLYITGNINNNKNLFEVFLRIGDMSSTENLLLDTIARQISRQLQRHENPKDVVESLLDKGNDPFWTRINDDEEKSEHVKSIIDCIGRVLYYHFIDNTYDFNNNMGQCPICGKKTLTYSSGCRGGSCTNEECNYTSCG